MTTNGFTEPIATEEGHQQGRRAACEGSNASQAFLSAALPKQMDTTIPSDRGPLPAHHFCFSDERPTLRLVEQCLSNCLRVSQWMARIPNPTKLEFFAVELRNGQMCAGPAPVSVKYKPTSPGSP